MLLRSGPRWARAVQSLTRTAQTLPCGWTRPRTPLPPSPPRWVRAACPASALPPHPHSTVLRPGKSQGTLGSVCWTSKEIYFFAFQHSPIVYFNQNSKNLILFLNFYVWSLRCVICSWICVCRCRLEKHTSSNWHKGYWHWGLFFLEYGIMCCTLVC